MTCLLGMLKVQTHFCKYKGAKIKVKQYGTTDFKTLRLSNNQTFGNLIPYFILLISRLPNIVPKSFCTPDEAMDPTMFAAREIKEKLRRIFFWTPCSWDVVCSLFGVRKVFCTIFGSRDISRIK